MYFLLSLYHNEEARFCLNVIAMYCRRKIYLYTDTKNIHPNNILITLICSARKWNHWTLKHYVFIFDGVRKRNGDKCHWNVLFNCK